MLYSALLDGEDLLKPDTFHVDLHGAENEVAGAGLECVVGLTTDQDSIRWALGTHPGCLVDRGTDE